MNISTGGPHILLFERDQQFTALLISEFQLAGYECHTARTAVEVFDAIARYPIRLVLVNLAQAAAARREFWVALDTQRRGRGVQVMTFQCFNLAGYGSQDPEERSQPVLADMQVDGMLGLLNLVEAVRNRVPGSGSTNTQPRVHRPTGPTPSIQQRGTANTPQVGGNSAYRSGTSSDIGSGQIAARAGQAILQQQPIAPVAATAAAPPTPMSAAQPPPTPATNNTNQQSYTDKIRAVLYPTQRGASIQTGGQILQESANPAYEPQVVNRMAPTTTQNSMLQQLANGQIDTAQSESSLDQLSRMLRERPAPTTSEYNNDEPPRYTPRQATQEVQFPIEVPQAVNMVTPTQVATTQGRHDEEEQASIAQTTTPRLIQEADTLSVQTLRASPIRDLPLEQPSNGNRGNSDVYTTNAYNNGQAPVTPLASITTPMPSASPTPVALPTPTATPSATQRPPIVETTAATARPRPVAPSVSQTPVSPPMHSSTIVKEEVIQPIQQEDIVEEEEQEKVPTKPLLPQEEVEEVPDDNPALFEKLRTETQEEFQRHIASVQQPANGTIPNNAMLLDIVQSLPPMPSTSVQQAQQQTLQGRATRTLGSVLLEGHLVPQSRLEVAQNIQRMLRGVDLNYQLGEILLMFKLLTPDQLLAASLVSYGLITTQQIVALGRIRQELHSIGLEYDLENLLILFRILTPEQLREVRSGWQS